MATITFPYADPGIAAFEELDTYVNKHLLAGSHPTLEPAFAFDLANDTSFAQFSVVGLDANKKLAMATPSSVETAATGTLTFSAAGVEDETIVIGAQTYRLRDTLAAANDVLIGGDASETAANLVAAIMGTGTAGTDYHAGTTVNADVTASADEGVVTLVAKVAGLAGNLVATTETSAAAAEFAEATLTGGVNAGGVKAIGVVAHACALGSTGTGKGNVFYSGNFNMDALVWDESFATDAQKLEAFFGAPTPTNIIVQKKFG